VKADLYYLDTQNSDMTNDWKYFRVSPIFGMHIEVCEVSFPSFRDMGVPVQHAWIVGLASAYDIKGQHLRTLGIDQDRAIMIGMVAKP
jgi:hypothetical protein